MPRALLPLVILILIGLIAALVAGFPGTKKAKKTQNAQKTPPAAPVLTSLGVLNGDLKLMARDQAAGIRFVTLNVSWAKWEPKRGVFDLQYVKSQESSAAQYRRNGWRIAIDLGLQQPPAWVLAVRGGQLVDQFGTPSGTPDFEFSNSVRTVAADYMRRVVAALGTVAYYRIGLSEHGEAHYPDMDSARWWAFGPAQSSAVHLPAGVGSTPLPGWTPGSSRYHGHVVSPAQVSQWYDWYFGAMVNAHDWEIDTFRAAGFSGSLELVIPGTGALPDRYTRSLTQRLRSAEMQDQYFTMNTGAVWWKFLDQVNLSGPMALDISSVYDQSGDPRGNGCQASDAKVDYLVDPQVDDWSDTRWLAYLAGRHHLPVLGENPGFTPASDLSGTVELVRACRLLSLQWAFDYLLDGRQGSATLPQVARSLRS